MATPAPLTWKQSEQQRAVCPLCAPDDSDDESRCISCTAPNAAGLRPTMQEEPSQREGQGFESP